MWLKLRQLLTDSLAYGLGSVLSKVIGFLLIPLYTRYLAPRDYGVLAMLSIVTLVFQALAYLGLKSAIFRRFSLAEDEAEKRSIYTTGLAVVGLSALALSSLGQLAAPWLSSTIVGDPTTTLLVRLGLLSALLGTIGGVPLLVMQADRQARLVASLNLALFLATATLTVGLVAGLGLGVSGVVIGGLLANCILLPLQLLLARSYLTRRPVRAMARSMLTYGLPFVPYRLQLVAVAVLGEYMVRHLLGLDEAGVYSIALRFALPLGFVVGAINQAWWPYKFKIFKEETDPADLFRGLTTYYLAALSYLWIGVVLWGPEVIRWMTPREYHAAALLLPAAALIPMSQAVYQMLGTGMELGKEARSIPLVGSIGLIATVVGTGLLVPWLGARGAAFSSAAAWLVMALVIHRLAQRRFVVRYDWSRLLLLAVLASATYAAAHSGSALPLPGRLAIAGVLSLLYPLLAIGVLASSAAERGRLRQLGRALRHRLQPGAPSVSPEDGPGDRSTARPNEPEEATVESR